MEGKPSRSRRGLVPRIWIVKVPLWVKCQDPDTEHRCGSPGWTKLELISRSEFEARTDSPSRTLRELSPSPTQGLAFFPGERDYGHLWAGGP